MRRSLLFLLNVGFALLAQADIAPHAGLWQVVFKGTSSATAERDWSRDIMSVPEGADWQTQRRRELGPILAYKFGNPASNSKVTSAIHGDQPYWFDYTQIAYCGFIHLESDKTYKFRANIDDDGYIKITDAQTGVATVLIDFTDNRLHTSGSYAVSRTGWHAIEIRMGNGMGGAGGNPGDSSESCGISADNGATWKKIMDPGDGSFLRVYNDYPFTVGEVRYEKTRLSCVLTDEGIRPEPLKVYAFADVVDRGKTNETWASDFTLGTWEVGGSNYIAHVSAFPPSAKVVRFAAVPEGDWFRASWSEALDVSSWTVVTDPDPKIHDCTVASVDYSTASFTLNVLSQGTGSETGYILKQFGYDGQEYRAVEIVKTAADVAGCKTIKQDGLRPGSVYRFRLAVSNDLGRVVWTDPIEISTTAEDLGFMYGSAGLWQVRFTNANADWTKDIFSVSVGTDWKTQRRRELGPIQAYATRSQKYTSEVWGDQVYWINEDYNQWAYAGLIYLDATKTYKFRTKIDDDELLKITDAGTGAETTLINDTRDGSSVITSAAYSPSVTGWHTIEIRFSDGSGGAGGYDSSSSYKNTYNLGYSDDNGSTWKFLLDPGDGSFLCVGKADDIVAGEMLFDGTSLSTVLTRNVANAAYAPEAKVYAVYGADYHANDLSAWESENKKLLGTWREGLATFSPYLGDLPSNIRYVRFVIVAGSGATAGTFWTPTILVNELEKNIGVQPRFGNVEFASNTCVTATFDVQVLTRGADASAVTLAATYSYEGEHGFEETTELLSGSDVVGTRTVTLKNLKPNARYSATFTLKNNRSESVTSEPVLFNTQAESFGNIAAFPGLWQARFVEANRDWSKNLFDVAEGTDWQTKRRRELGAIQAYATRTQRYTSEVWKDEIYWIDQNENQWVYGGYIYLEKDKAYKFRSKIDDNEKIAVTDFGTGVTTVLIDDQADSSDVLTSASFTPTVTGWHRIEIRFSDGYGGAGGYDTSSNYKNTNNLGFSSDGGSTWQFLIDPGDGTLLLPERPDSVRVQETVFDGVTLNAVIGRREVPFAETSTMKVYAVFDVAYHGDVLADWPDAQKVYLGTWNGAEGTFIAGVPGLGDMRYLRFVLTSADGARQHWSDTLFLPETPRNATEVPVLFGATVTATSTASAAFHVDVLAQGTNTVSATLKFVYAYEDEKGPHCITNEVARREKLTGTYDYEIVAIPAGTDYTAYFYVETDCEAIARFPADEPLSFTTLPANTLLAASAATSSFRYDVRSTYPGKLVRGTVTIGDADGGEPMAWDTSTLSDGWNKVTKGGHADDLVVLNNPNVSIEGGRLELNAEWTADKTHLIRNTVYIPSGRTLTVTQGAVVKFCAGTGIKIEDGGTLNIVGAEGADVIFTAANDDTVGEKIVGLPKGVITHKGVWKQTSSATLTDNNYVQMRGTSFGDYSTVYLNDSTAFRSSESALIPVTLGGANRSKPFSIDWVAKDASAKFGEDYTLASGRITWNQYNEGTKTITIPLVKEHVVGSNTTFTIEIVTNRAVNVGRQVCTVTIREWDTLNLQSAAMESSFVRFDMRKSTPGRTMHGIEKITSGGNDDETAVENWNTATLEDGWTTLTRSTNSLEVLAVNAEPIAIEGGRIAANTMWTSDKTHLLRNTVYIPSGKTLTVTTNAVVKFMSGTGIKIEDGGKLNVIGSSDGDVIFTAANDDTAGAVIPGMPEGAISHNGFWKQSSSANFTDNGWIETRNWGTGLYPEMWLNDTTAFRSIGMAYIPVTIGGSRDQTLSVDWRTVDGTAKYGEDFTQNAGRVTWNRASEGTKIIQIPLVKNHIVGGTTSFEVEIVVNRGVNVSRRTCTVEIRELDTLDFSFGSTDSAPVRYDERQTFPGLLNTGVVTLGSPDGKTTTAWNTKDEENGWVTVTSGETNADLAVINDAAISIEGGRLTSNTTWSSNVTHLVRNTVYVPNGITLTLSEGTVVKYLEGTTIKIEDGGKLNVVGSVGNDVVLTAANDDTVGAEIPAVDKTEPISFTGITKMSSGTYTDNMYVQTRGFTYGNYPTLTIHDAVVNRVNGKVYLPVTVSGTTRNQSFNVDWEVVPDSAVFGTDYKVKSGTLSWAKSGDGTKQIEIPLNTSSLSEERRSFKVKFVAARATNVADGEAVVTIHEYTDCGIKTDVALAESPVSADFAVQESIKRQPIFRGETEEIRYDGKWQTRRDAKDTVVRISVESDNGITRLAEYPGDQVGAYLWRASDYNVGYYTLKHEIVYAETREILDTVTKSFSIVDEDDVVLHGGTLTQNETWKAGKTHVVYETVVVPSIYTLFIEPGAIVKFMSGTGIDISQGGALFANAIIFTHIDDDTIGGDTLSDGYTVAPSMDSYALNGNFTFGADTEIRYITQASALTGTISDQRVLSRGSTYRVSGTVTVVNGGSLTIPSGTVLKMEVGASIVVNAGGRINSNGTRAAPVIITSMNDDSYSGKMEGSNSNPQPGDWTKITINGTGFFDFTKILYSSRNSTTGAINMNGGTTTFINSEIAHCAYDAVGVESGHFYMTNSIIADALLAFRHWARDPIVNCVIYDCGRLTQGGGQHFVNCVFSRISETWEAFGFPQNGTTYNNCVFWNEDGSVLTGEGRQDAMTVCGKNGNIWGNPLFIDPDNYDFRISEMSPCVDAADSLAAPARDLYGQPRLTVKASSDVALGVPAADIGVCEVMLRSVTSDIDLEARSVRGETNAVPGKLLFVKWEVANVGGSPVDVEWRDTISLVSEDGLQEVTLGEKKTSSTIAIGGTAFCSAYFTVPAMAEGKWYPKVNVNSYHDIFEGTLTANNVLVGNAAIDIETDKIDASEGDEGVVSAGSPKVLKMSFAAEDENRMVRIAVPAGVTVSYGFGFVPRGANASGKIVSSGSEVLFKVPDGVTDVYVSLESDKTVEYAMTFEDGNVVITSVTPDALPSSGEVTITIKGAGFTSASKVLLKSDESVVHVNSMQYLDSGNLLATIDCASLIAGARYDLYVVSADNKYTFASKLDVEAVKGFSKVVAHLSLPTSIRQGREVMGYVEYENVGNAIAPLPFFVLSGGDAVEVDILGDNQWRKKVAFVGCGDASGLGLAPGAKYRTVFKFKSLTSSSANITLTALDGKAQIDYNALKAVILRGQVADEYKIREMLGESWTDCMEKVRGFLKNHSGALSKSIRMVDLIRLYLMDLGGNSIYGTVVDAVGETRDGLPVYLVDSESKLVSLAETQNGGCYSFENIDGGNYRVVVGGMDVQDEQPVLIDGCDVRKNVLIKPANAIRINWNGVVVKDGMKLVLNCEETSECLTYEISRQEIGKTLSSLHKGCWSVELQDDGIRATEEAFFEVASGGQTVLLKPIGALVIECSVSNDSGDAIGSAIVKCEGNALTVGSTDKNGYWAGTFENCENAFVEVAADGYCPWQTVVSNRQNRLNVTLKRGSKVKGVLRDGTGVMSLGSALFKSSDYTKMAFADLDGKFEVVLPSGTYDVLAPVDKRLVGTIVVGDIDITKDFNLTAALKLMRQPLAAAGDASTWDAIGLAALESEMRGWAVVMLGSYEVMGIYHEPAELLNHYLGAIGKNKSKRTTPVRYGADSRLAQLAKKDNEGYDCPYSEVFNFVKERIVGKIQQGATSGWCERLTKNGDGLRSHMSFNMKLTSPLFGCFGGMQGTYYSYTMTIDSSHRDYDVYHVSTLIRGTDEYEFNGHNDYLSNACQVLFDYGWASQFESSLEIADEFEYTLPKEPEEDIPTDEEYDRGTISIPHSIDPNEMGGIMGRGDGDTQRYVKPGEWMTYTVYFENKSTATAAAQEVKVSNPLSLYLDWSTFEMGEVAFNNQIDLGLSGKQNGASEVTMNGTSYLVRSKVTLDKTEGKVDWYLRIVDPSTPTTWPDDVFAGFLPPNDATYRGEGHLTYRIKVRDDAPAGVKITNAASIIFDYNDPIETDPAWWNQVAKVVSVEGSDGKAIKVAVDPAWIKTHVGESATDAEVATALNATGANGLKVWTSVALGLDPENPDDKFLVDVPQNADENSVAIKALGGELPTNAWMAIQYRLDRDTTGGGETSSGTAQSGQGFSIDIGGAADPTGIYQVKAVLSDDEGTSATEVPAANQIGILRKAAANKREIVPVPWTKFAAGAEDIAVSNLVKTAGLTAGDKLYVYDDSAKRYATWELQSDKTWKPVKTVKIVNGKLEVQTADSPEVATVKRGSGVWLERHDITKPIHFVGQHDAAPVEVPVEAGTTAMPKWNLVASPLLTDWDLNSVSEGVNVADRIIVPTGKEPRIYTRDATNAKWGYITYEANAKGIVKPVRKEDDTMLKAGTGFWYVSEGGAPTLRWREASEK